MKKTTRLRSSHSPSGWFCYFQHKAYVSKSRIKKVNPGDLLLFYRSFDFKLLTNIGIVEKIIRTNSAEEILSIVGKRTAYPVSDIRNFYDAGGLVILF